MSKFKVGDIVTVSAPENGYERFLNTVGQIVAIDRNLHRIKTKKGSTSLWYDSELQIAKNHIVLEIIKDL